MKKLALLALLMAIVTTAWCSLTGKSTTTEGTWSTTSDQTVKVWDFVSVNYVWRLEDGKIFDTNIEKVAKDESTFQEGRPYSPLTFTVWQRQMIAWFDQGVIGMKVWETKKLTIKPEDAYWQPDPKAILTTGADIFKQQGINPVVWQSYQFWMYKWKVLSASWTSITIDFNHELAWKSLVFEVTVLSASWATASTWN